MDDSERLIWELSECPSADGVTMAGILELPDLLRPTLKEMVRGHSFTRSEICARLELDDDAGRQVIALLVEKGYVQAADTGDGEPVYRIALAPIRGHPISDDL